MSIIFNKLNLKSQTEILVLNAPESFESELAALNNITIRRNAGDVKEIAFSPFPSMDAPSIADRLGWRGNRDRM
jgi:hypothetical protein